MPSLRQRVRNIVLVGGFLVPSTCCLVQAWVPTCPSVSSTRDGNFLVLGGGSGSGSGGGSSSNSCSNSMISSSSTDTGTGTGTRLSMTSKNDNNLPPPSPRDKNNDKINEDSESGSRQHRLAKAQAEIDRILNNPVDPPFDFENEMKKVASISPPLIKEGSAEFQLEEQVSEAEEQLYRAVKAEDYDAASKKSAEISQTHVDDCGLVLQANSAFYRAFSEKDIREMERLWLRDRSCVCIHPSFQPITGVSDILSTWKRMFESSAGSFQRTWIDPRDIQLTVKATTAVVTCVEDVYARRFVRGKKRKSELVNKLTATNIFRKVGGRWYMTYHHSSWHADSEAAKRALKTSNKATKLPVPTSLSSTASSSTTAKGIGLSSPDPFDDNPLQNLRSKRPKRGPTASSDSDDDDESDDDSRNGDRSEIDSILGIENFGPILGDDDSDGKKSDGEPKLSSNLDFLKELGLGGLDGVLGMGSTDGTGLPPGSIIRISKVNGGETVNGNSGNNNNNNDMDDEYDDEYDDEDGEYDGEYDDEFEYDDNGPEDEEERANNRRNDAGKSVLELLGEKSRENDRERQLQQQRSSSSSSSLKLSRSEVRQKCIAALRQLSSDGRISPKQKRVLLTDIISSSARREQSLVEHAYKLLCVDPTDEAAAEEDFVDQCQVFAQSLFEMR